MNHKRRGGFALRASRGVGDQQLFAESASPSSGGFPAWSIKWVGNRSFDIIFPTSFSSPGKGRVERWNPSLPGAACLRPTYHLKLIQTHWTVLFHCIGSIRIFAPRIYRNQQYWMGNRQGRRSFAFTRLFDSYHGPFLSVPQSRFHPSLSMKPCTTWIPLFFWTLLLPLVFVVFSRGADAFSWKTPSAAMVFSTLGLLPLPKLGLIYATSGIPPTQRLSCIASGKKMETLWYECKCSLVDFKNVLLTISIYQGTFACCDSIVSKDRRLYSVTASLEAVLSSVSLSNASLRASVRQYICNDEFPFATELRRLPALNAPALFGGLPEDCLESILRILPDEVACMMSLTSHHWIDRIYDLVRIAVVTEKQNAAPYYKRLENLELLAVDFSERAWEADVSDIVILNPKLRRLDFRRPFFFPTATTCLAYSPDCMEELSIRISYPARYEARHELSTYQEIAQLISQRMPRLKSAEIFVEATSWSNSAGMVDGYVADCTFLARSHRELSLTFDSSSFIQS